jgi:predicted NBD/HSP70 family sugar kinase
MRETPRKIDEEPPHSGSSAVPVIGAMGAGPALSKAQKRFNQLVEKLKGQREELRRWQAYQRFYQQQRSDRYQPMATRLREQHIAMAQVLDAALDGRELGKRERDKARYILNQLLATLLAVAAEPVVVRLHDKYSAASYAELQRERMDALRAAAADSLKIDVDAYTGGESCDEFEDWIVDQVRASHAAAAEAEQPAKRRSPQSAKRAALRDQVAEGGTRAVREAYRKLVSELHPDRETDPEEQIRKTALMQQVNQAYKAGDLLGLLELQLGIEQIDAAALAGLADERLRHYVHVLEEQARQIRGELADVMEPFAALLDESSPRKVTTDAVQRHLDQEIRELKSVLRKVEMDLICFRDVRQLKQSLGQYRVEPLDDDDLRLPGDF